MYSIPAPVIKTILDHCDLPSAITFARVTKRCSTIFRQCREEILIRGEYVNVPNMFHHCSDEFIITMSKHEFFDEKEARRCCLKMRYQLHEKLGYGEISMYSVGKKMMREIYKNGEFHNINTLDDYKLDAAKMGIDLNIPYPDNYHGLHAALILQDEKMINKLSNYGDFYTYCSTGYYHLADNYEVEFAINCINDSNNSMATFEYIEKRGYKFKQREYLMIKNYELLKLVTPRITDLDAGIPYISIKDYNASMLLYDTLLKFTTIDKFINYIDFQNVNFIRFLVQKHSHSVIRHNILMRNKFITKLLDLIDNKNVMLYACIFNNFTLIRALVKLNGQQWAQQFDHPFIKKYY